jgi:hypothetical protein
MKIDKHDVRYGDWIRLVRKAYIWPKGTIGVCHGPCGDDEIWFYVARPGLFGLRKVRRSHVERISVHKDELLEGDQLVLIEDEYGIPKGSVVTLRSIAGGKFVTVEDEKKHDVFCLPYTNLMIMKYPQKTKSFAQSLRGAFSKAVKFLIGL